MLQEIIDGLEEKVNDLFLIQQNKLGITDGGVYCEEQSLLDNDIIELAYTIQSIIERQRRGL